MVSDSKDGVVSLRLWDFCDEIQGYCFKQQCFWSRVNRLEWHMYRMSIDFISLTVCTSLDIVLDLLTHSWPPVVSWNQLYSVINTWMSIDWWVVVCLNHHSFVVKTSSYYLSYILIPCALNPFESMRVDPGFKCVFVLFIYWVFNCHFFCRDKTVGWSTSSVHNWFAIGMHEYFIW